MGKIKERFLVDEHGNQVGVLLEIAEYRRLLDELEELASIKAYDKAKASRDEAIPFEQAVSEIEQSRP
jgi:PHD/YefM family antitoxin component YafN of YafNO toxin-antitoxin module